MKILEKTNEYENWFNDLKDKLVRARIAARIRRLSEGNAGDVEPVGEGVSEMRMHFGSGWRVYYTERHGTLIILLAGGKKSTQKRDIKLALELARNL
ncbi:MAG: type II toxin-antitoxin system RelE/ParE family toxin [Gallionellaceae bacterium]|jgi:putative addiction module killer protein